MPVRISGIISINGKTKVSACLHHERLDASPVHMWLMQVFDEGADVAMWLAAVKTAAPEKYDKMVTLQCSMECAYL